MKKIELSKAEATKMFEAGTWKAWSLRERAVFQIRCTRLVMPFDKFHEAIEKTLGRPVWIHEFGLNYAGIWAELMENAPAPTMQEIIEMVPVENMNNQGQPTRCGQPINFRTWPKGAIMTAEKIPESAMKAAREIKEEYVFAEDFCFVPTVEELAEEINEATGLAKKEAALRAAQVWLEHPATHDAFRKDAALYEQLEATCVQVQYALTQGA